jgi:hypothetical protein
MRSPRQRAVTYLLETDMLAQDLSTLQLRAPVTGDEAVLDWRQRPHDGLVLAVAVAAWLGERQHKGPWRAEWV